MQVVCSTKECITIVGPGRRVWGYFVDTSWCPRGCECVCVARVKPVVMYDRGRRG